MKYLVLSYDNENRLAAMSPRDRATYEAACLTTVEQLMVSGHLRAAARLQDAHLTTTVQIQNGQIAVAAGSMVETNEPFKEFFVIEARDLNETIRLAAQLLQARNGSIEVRSLTTFDVV
jgi:hypothetical protein